MNIAVTVALVPALFTVTDGRLEGPVAVAAGATLETMPVVAAAVPGSNHVVVLGPSDIAALATTTTAAPPPTTTAVKRSVVVTKPVHPKAGSPNTVAPPTATTAPPARPKPKPAADGSSETGKGSWYDHQPGICAHKSLPFGTVVTVTDRDNGRSVTCTVGDRGPYVDGWIIDLNPREFDQLAPASTGVIPVRITW